MKREKEVPQELLAYLNVQRRHEEEVNKKVFNQMILLCSIPIRAVRMNMLIGEEDRGADKSVEGFKNTIIPAIDIYTTDNAVLKKGFLKRDALSYFISGTHRVFPYGHVYASSGYICLGTIFVPSAIPERSPAMPIETLFLHNDRNLNHGNSHLTITKADADLIWSILIKHDVTLNSLARVVTDKPGADIIKNDEIWNLAMCVLNQKPFPVALSLMSAIYDVIFSTSEVTEKKENEEEQ